MRLITPSSRGTGPVSRVNPYKASNALGMETRYVLVELHNHVHLSTVYGDAFADEAIQTLQQRVRLWGALVVDLRPGVFLAVFVAEAVTPTADDPSDFARRVENWQLELAAILFEFEGGAALPVVTVRSVESSRLGPVSSGFCYPEALDQLDALSPQLPLPQFGAGWCLGYKCSMAQAVALVEALNAGQICLEFQPVMRHDQAGVELYAEGLLRVSDFAANGDPASFIPALERLGLVRMLDRAVVLAALNELEQRPDARLGCNVSACSVMLDSFWGLVVDRLAAQPDVGARLTIEITETAPLPDFDVAVAFVRRLKALGCQIALDDFGAGHSSIAFAYAVKPDVIKVDGSYLHRARESVKNAQVLRQMVSLCRALAPTVVVEKVESEQDARLAIEAGAVGLQGFGVACEEVRHRCRVQGIKEKN